MAARTLTITVNPAVDVNTHIDALVPGKKLRCAPPTADPGGGGINVARIIHKLGGAYCALATFGGETGARLRKLCQRENLEVAWHEIAGSTREDLQVFEECSGHLFRFMMPGPHMPEAEQESFLARVAAMSPGFDYLVSSGSLGPGLAPEFQVRLAGIARQAGARFVLDSSGDGLKAAVGAGLHIIKPNMTEAAALAGRDVERNETHQQALLDDLLAQGIEIVFLTLGPEGVLAGDQAGQRIRLRPPRVKVRSAVGAGDSFLGGALHMLASGGSLEDAARIGIAASAATVRTDGTLLAERAEILELYEQLKQAKTQ